MPPNNNKGPKRIHTVCPKKKKSTNPMSAYQDQIKSNKIKINKLENKP